jgi:hypothetical protein
MPHHPTKPPTRTEWTKRPHLWRTGCRWPCLARRNVQTRTIHGRITVQERVLLSRSSSEKKKSCDQALTPDALAVLASQWHNHTVEALPGTLFSVTVNAKDVAVGTGASFTFLYKASPTARNKKPAGRGVIMITTQCTPSPTDNARSSPTGC